MHILIPGWLSVKSWIYSNMQSWVPGWGWYTLIRIWSGMRLDLDGWRWDVYLRGLMELRRCVGGSDKHGGMFAPKWSWYAIIVTWIKLRCDINASEMLLEWRWDANTGLWWRWEWTWMDVRYTSRDLDVVDIRMAWAETHTLGPRYCEVRMGLAWDAILLIQRDLICEMAGCETSTSWPGLDLRCDMNWS